MEEFYHHRNDHQVKNVRLVVSNISLGEGFANSGKFWLLLFNGVKGPEMLRNLFEFSQ